MNNGTENLEWAMQEVKELASKENRPIDKVSFRYSRDNDDSVELVIKSGDKEIAQKIFQGLFTENENIRQELREQLKAIVRRIKPKVRQNSLL